MIEKRLLGNTGIEVSRIGISSSFGADESVFEEAFQRGCNYFTWGTFIKGRSSSFKTFLKRISASGRREDIVLGLLSYSHTTIMGDYFLQSALKQLDTDYVDGIVLGYYSKRPPQRILDWACSVKEQGLVRTIGITTHNRSLVPILAQEGIIDYFHIRYNAVHSGAEQDIFPKLPPRRPGLVSFTATSWGHLFNPKKLQAGVTIPTAGDCYRYVLAQQDIDCCMMGVKNLKMLQENIVEIEKGSMTETELSRMKKIGNHVYGKPRDNG